MRGGLGTPSPEAAVYVISVAAELTGLDPQTLRTYERLGLITPGRTVGGGRRYSYRDIERLREIPYGETRSYAEVAAAAGSPRAVRAVGTACRRNPLPVAIPCHRVVAADGLGGFSGGDPGHELETKRWLLENEGALPPALV